MKIRYLGDAVLGRRARDLADRLGRRSTFEAEYLALMQLPGDARVTLDHEPARLAENVVGLASIEEPR